MSDFSQPQRQSLVGVVIMFADTLQKSLRALLPVLIGLALQINHIKQVYLWPGLAAIVVAIAIIAYLKYRNFTFYLDNSNQEFVIHSGILNKSRLALPLDKIQQVNINQSLIQKIIGVHSLEVDTAGSGNQEVSIRAITHELALSLKARLLENEFSVDDLTSGSMQTSISTPPLVKVSLLSLFKTGITSNYVRSFGLLLAFVITAFQHIEDFLRASKIDDDPLNSYLNSEVLLRFMTFIIVGIIILTLLINLTRTVVRYYDFTITKQQQSLLLAYGLLTTKNTIIRPEKVQIVTIGRNYFQKKLDIADIKIRQASNLEANNHEKKKTAIEIPGLSTGEKDSVMQFLLGRKPEKGETIRPNIRKLLLEVFKYLIIPTVSFLLFIYFVNEAKEYLVYLPLYLGFAGLLVYFAYRNSRLYISDEFIIKQSGAWDIDNDYLSPHKIQAVVTHQYFWQKASNVGGITIHTAGGNISFGPANYIKIKHLANYWLFQVESENRNWM